MLDDSHISSELIVAASEYVKEGEYWMKKLSGDLVKTSFPYDQFYAGDIDEVSMRSVELKLTGEVYSRLMWISKGADHTLHMILVTGIVILLHKYTGHKDIMVGAPIYKQDIEGQFVNTALALRGFIDDNMTFKELLLQLRQTILQANENQNYPLETLLYRLNIPFTGTDFPLFDVVVLLENIHDRKYIEHLYPNVIVSFRRTDEAVEGVMEFNSFLFESSSIERIAAHFTGLLGEVLFHVDCPIAEINILSPEERRLQLVDFNRTRTSYPVGQTIHRLIEEQAHRTPTNIALLGQVPTGETPPAYKKSRIINKEISITYRELEEQANQLANYLCKGKNIQPGDRVGILMDNSLELVTAILGILKAGAAYVPIDPVLPEERIKFIIDDAKPGLIISLKKYIRILNRLQWECVSFDTFLCLDSSDIHGEEEREKSELMDEKLWDYVAETAVDEITGGGWNTSYTGEPFSKKEMDEYGDNVLKKLVPVLRPDMRVLEIGCASGISMYRIAPRVKYYHGTDLSPKMIERNKERVKREGHKNITLSAVPAHHIDTIEDRNFDLIILNSVVQSFHGHNYLRKVIRKTIDLLGQGGYLFVGDIMDHDLKEVFIADLKEFKQTNRDKIIQTKTDFSTELFVARGFFEDLKVDMTEIREMEVGRKIYTIENELTKYRYDVLMTVAKTGKPGGGAAKKQRNKYQEDLRVLEGCGTGKPVTGVNPGHPAYVIYTSGTTGTPRGVVIEHRSLVNYAWWAVKTYTRGESAPITVPLYSSISFDLTVTSIYLPLLTGGTISIYSSEEHRFPVQRIVKDDRVDIVKATPSHLKILQHEITGNNQKLKTFIVGGEELERALAQDIYLGFSRRLDIYNEYGPTEATVGCMIYKFNYEKDRRRSVSIGLPADNVSIYILDPYLNPVPINGIGEIYIGGDALARGYINNPELTAEKFLSLFYRSYRSYRSYISKKIYKTGDLARRLPDGNIEFLGRIDEQVKIRGYRIELKEIESQLLTHSDVKEAVVIARELSLSESDEGGVDRTLCAYIVLEKNTEMSEFITYLSARLPDYMIPSYFMPVEHIPLTYNGKVDKRLLPEPKIEGNDDTYVAPENKTQLALVEIWSNVLKIEKSIIGINSNFFELGGHSLRATILIAGIHKALEVKVPLAEIFKHPFIRELADYIDQAAVEEFSRIEPVEKKDYYLLSSAQKRLYILQQLEPDGIGYNESMFHILEGQVDRRQFADTFRKLIQRHESLRTSFHLVKDEPIQRVHETDEVEFEIEYHDLTSINAKKQEKSPGVKAETIVSNFLSPFELSQAPLLRAGLIKEEQEKYVLMVDIHHIITDGTSMGILPGEFMDLYNGEKLPLLQIHYKDFSEWQNSETVRETLDKQQTYWWDEFAGEIPVLELPTDYARPGEKNFEGRVMAFDFSIPEAEALRKLARQEEATLYMVLLAAFSILLFKLSRSEDIVVGTPIAGRRHADLQSVIGMFVNTLAMRNYPRADRTFLEFLKEVKNRTLEAFENQDYQFEDLVERLDVPRDTSRNPLFEVMFAVQNMELSIVEIPRLKLMPYNRDTHVSKFDLTMHVTGGGRWLRYILEYSTKLFRTETIERIAAYFQKVVISIIERPGEKISRIDIISDEEKNRVLLRFNNTEGEFPADKTLHRLFEEQVERTADQVALIGPPTNWALTYKNLNFKSNQLARILRQKGGGPDQVVGLMVERSFEMIIGMLAIMKAGGAYLPIDPQYPGERKKHMLKNSGVNVLLINENSKNIPGDIPADIELINTDDSRMYTGDSSNLEPINNGAHLVYVIYTSGSTGIPKGVMLEHRNLVNLVLFHHNHTNIDCTNVLQFATPSFDASIHEISAALLAGGRLYLIDRETRADIYGLFDLIGKARIKTVFLPMSLLRVIFGDVEYIKLIPDCIEHIQTAGEQVIVNDAFKEYLKNNFVYLHNHYGPSETHVVTALTLDPRTDIPGRPSIGTPILNTKIYILDSGNHLVPVGVPGELCIGGVMLGRGYWGDEQLTREKFPDNPFAPGEKMYRTGDLAKWLPNGNIDFLGRIDHQVKVRGFRVEPGEIETRLLKHEKIKEAVVLTKEDKSGNKYLCAYIVYDGVTGADNTSNTALLREFLGRVLPDYMIPSYFIYLDKIPLTPNGKINHRVLPQSELLGDGALYVAPDNELERKLAAIWWEILDISPSYMGINDDFFQLGGHSLKATILISRIHKRLGIKVPLTRIFRTPTIKGLSRYIKKAEPVKFVSMPAVEKREYYVLSSAQQRLYLLQQLDLNSNVYHLLYHMHLYLGENFEIEKLEEIFRKLMVRHECLRTSFETTEGEVVQRVHREVDFAIEYYDLTGTGVEAKPAAGNEQSITSIIENFIRSFDLSEAPLFRVGLINTGAKNCIFLIDMHHIITDATSQNILVEEFKGLHWHRENQLPGLRLQYKDYARWQTGKEYRELVKRQEAYWLKVFSPDLPVLSLPIDYRRPAIQSFDGSIVNFVLHQEDSEALKKFARENNTTLYMLILAVINLLLSKLSGQEDIIIGTPIAARRHADLESIVGMFVNTLAMRSFPGGNKTLKEFLTEVKTLTLEAFENQEYPFEELVEKAAIGRDTSRNPIFDVMFSLLNQSEYWAEVPDIKDGSYIHFQGPSKFDMSFTVVDAGNKLFINIEYGARLFKPATIERIIGYFKKIAAAVTAGPQRKLSDIDLIFEEEKKQVLVDFNNTEAGYPDNLTLHQLFAQQLERTPGGIALKGTWGHPPPPDLVSITYGELNEKSHQLAGLLIEKGVQTDTIVAIMLERSLEMIIGILAILKAGGAYMPIDPDYPRERLNYMLTDSGARFLVTTPGLAEKFAKLSIVNCQLLMVNEKPSDSRRLDISPKEANSINNYQLTINNLQLDRTSLAYIIYTSGTTGKSKGVLIQHRNVVRLMFNDKFHFDFSKTDVWTLFHSFCFDFSVWEMYGALLYGGQLVVIPKIVTRDPGRYLRLLKEMGVTVLNQTPSAFYHLIDEELNSLDQSLHLKYVIFGGEALNPLKLKEWQVKYPNTKLINMFGITETTVHVTLKEVSREDIEAGISNIGKPIPTLKTYIMDRNLTLLPKGVAGECCIGGDGVGRGYLNRPQLTGEKFVKDPYKSRDRLYKSGDLVRWLDSGDMEYLGRIDHQVKIRGFRVELGEIENQLLEHEEIKEVVVTVKEVPGGDTGSDATLHKDTDKYLCAYFVSEIELTVPQMREHLLRQLPDYMVPSYFMRLEHIPLTVNGKVDRKALQELGRKLETGSAYVPPRKEKERKIAKVWEEVLQLDKVGIHDNYFDLGGTSFEIIRINTKLKEIFQVEIPVVVMFRFTTVHTLADYLSRQEGEIRDRSEAFKRGKEDRMQRLRKRKGTLVNQ